jgi:hypothetical protein
MAQLVFDIETAAFPMDSFDEAQKKELLKLADKEETEERRERRREEIIERLSLHPFTAQVVAIGMLNVESNRGRVYYQAEGEESWRSDDGLIEFESGTELQILQWFWETVKGYDRFITFNGRRFDCPFLMIRSAIHGIRPTRNLMPYRYDFKVHCDLLDQLTFYGALPLQWFTLDLACRAFGIESPKREGITGLDVKDLFSQGRYREIARYCLGDVRATAELYRRWEALLSF